MQGIKKEVGMELHLEGLQFAGSEPLLILISPPLFSAQTFQVLVSVGRHNDCNVYENLVGKSASNHLKPGLKGARGRLLLGVVVGRNKHPENARMKYDKGR